MRRKGERDQGYTFELGLNVHCYLWTMFLGQDPQLLGRSTRKRHRKSSWDLSVLWGCHLGDNCENTLGTWKCCVLTSLSLSMEEIAACSPSSGLTHLGDCGQTRRDWRCVRETVPTWQSWWAERCVYRTFSHRSLTFKALDSSPAIMSANLHDILSVLSPVVLPDFWRGNVTSW